MDASITIRRVAALKKRKSRSRWLIRGGAAALAVSLLLNFFAAFGPTTQDQGNHEISATFGTDAAPTAKFQAEIEATLEIQGAVTAQSGTQILNFRLIQTPDQFNNYQWVAAGTLLMSNGTAPVAQCEEQLPQGGTRGLVIAIQRDSETSFATPQTVWAAITDENCNFITGAIRMENPPTTEYTRAVFQGSGLLLGSTSGTLTITAGLASGYAIDFRADPTTVLANTSFRLHGFLTLNGVAVGGKLITIERATTVDFASFTTVTTVVTRCQPQTCDGTFETSRTETSAGTFYFRASFTEQGTTLRSVVVSVEVLASVTATLTLQAVPNPAAVLQPVTFFADLTLNGRRNLDDLSPLTLWYTTPDPDTIFDTLVFVCQPQACQYRTSTPSTFQAGTYVFKVNITRTLAGLGTVTAESATVTLTVLAEGTQPSQDHPAIVAVTNLLGSIYFYGLVFMFVGLYVAKQGGLPPVVLLVLGVFIMGVLAMMGLLPFELLYIIGAVGALAIVWFVKTHL